MRLRPWQWLGGLIIACASTTTLAKVVISEVMWSGTDLSTADEWLELANTGTGSVDLRGWKITRLKSGSETTMLSIGSGTIAGSGFFLVSNFARNQSRLDVDPDLVTTAVTLDNTQLLLRLYDQSGTLLDAVDDGIGAPFAGSNTTPKASMERSVLEGSGQLLSNWRTAETFLSFDDGAKLFGTPRAPNGTGPRADSFPPREATNFRAATGSGVLTLQWAPSTSLDLQTQIVTFSPPLRSGSGNVLLTATASTLATPDVQNGITYLCRLQSRDANGNTSTGVSLSVLVGPDLTPPPEVSQLQAARSSGATLLRWQPPWTDDLDDILVLRRGEHDANPTLVQTLSGSLSSTWDLVSGSGALTYLLRTRDRSENTSSGLSIILPPFPTILISEVLADPSGDEDRNEWIELQNVSTMPLNLSGWTLDDSGSSRAFTITATSASGLLLSPGAFIAFRSAVTNLGLTNAGETVLLAFLGTTIASLTYPETAEDVSFGLHSFDPTSGRTTHGPLCTTTEGRRNTRDPPQPLVVVQSGVLRNQGSVTVNLEAAVASGSLTGGRCSWDYSDGFTSSSCNPPTHTFTEVGRFEVSLLVVNFCGMVGLTAQEIIVDPVAVNPTAGGGGAGGGADERRVGCTPSASGGARISEILPDPDGADEEGEWIELENSTDQPLQLCGWSLDDAEGGSRPMKLDAFSVAPHGLLLLTRRQTRIALNNEGDRVRLLTTSGTIDDVPYDQAPTGESFARRSDGVFLWTPHPTPGNANEFRSSTQSPFARALRISRVLPNPVGLDEGHEWIEIENTGQETTPLVGWLLDDGPGGSRPFDLSAYSLRPGERRQFTSSTTGIELTNTQDTARLLDPEGNVVSLVSWQDAGDGSIYSSSLEGVTRAPARVVRVVDGDTIDVLREGRTERVRLIGINTPETVHPHLGVQRWGREAVDFLTHLLTGREVILLFEAVQQDKYGRTLAYVLLQEGRVSEMNVNGEIVRQGLSPAYLRFPFTLSALFRALEAEARANRRGIWSDTEAAVVVDRQIAEELVQQTFEEQGLTITATPLPGLVASGTIVTFSTNIPAALFLAFDTGAFLPFSGSLLIVTDITITIYAETPTGQRSAVLALTYLVPHASYAASVRFSEFLSSPPKTGPVSAVGEYVELYNAGDTAVQLGGWRLDDTLGGSSRPFTLAVPTVVPPHAFLLLPSHFTKLSLNDEGETFRLFSPDGALQAKVTYPKLQRGEAYAVAASSPPAETSQWCRTDLPTPGTENRCLTFTNLAEAPDSDQDFLPDDREALLYGTDAIDPDTDHDLFPDGFEVEENFDPLAVMERTRERRFLYRSFLAEKLHLSVRRYPKKGIVVRGRTKGFRSITVALAGITGAVEFTSSADSWEYVVTDSLPPGDFPLTLLVTDILFQRYTLSPPTPLSITEPYAGVVPTVTQAQPIHSRRSNDPVETLPRRYRITVRQSAPTPPSPSLSPLLQALSDQVRPRDLPPELTTAGSGVEGHYSRNVGLLVTATGIVLNLLALLGVLRRMLRP